MIVESDRWTERPGANVPVFFSQKSERGLPMHIQNIPARTQKEENALLAAAECVFNGLQINQSAHIPEARLAALKSF